MFDSIVEFTAKLTATGYFIDPVMIKVVYLASRMQKPLLLEGPAGSGKIQLAGFQRGNVVGPIDLAPAKRTP